MLFICKGCLFLKAYFSITKKLRCDHILSKDLYNYHQPQKIWKFNHTLRNVLKNLECCIKTLPVRFNVVKKNDVLVKKHKREANVSNCNEIRIVALYHLLTDYCYVCDWMVYAVLLIVHYLAVFSSFDLRLASVFNVTACLLFARSRQTVFFRKATSIT